MDLGKEPAEMGNRQKAAHIGKEVDTSSWDFEEVLEAANCCVEGYARLTCPILHVL